MKILNSRQARSITNLAVSELAKYLKDNNLSTIVLGISGGLDSAVMAVIGLRAIEKLANIGYRVDYIYDFLNVESQSDDLRKARLLAHEIGFNLGEYDYTEWFRSSPIRLASHLELPRLRVANGNLKCRLRMLHLYDRAQLTNGVVLDTDDLSENLMGFWTRHGDVGDVKIIQELTKDEVRDLGEYLDVTKVILFSAPGDGLGVTDTNMAKDQLKMDYLQTDYIISRLIQSGLKINGHLDQLNEKKILQEIAKIAKEISEPTENVVHVATQSLKTAFKRRYGDDVLNLLSERQDLGLPVLGSEKFNHLYLQAIKKSA